MPHSPYDSYWSNDYLASLNDLRRLQKFKPLVADDELRTLAANVRERLSALGNHSIVSMYLLALQCLESGLFYEDTDAIRTRLKVELRDAVGSLDELIAKEGTQRERELKRAEAIAADRQRVVTYAWHRSAMSFKRHPNRWFDPVPEAEYDGS